MKILALTFGDLSCPSTNYRLYQYKDCFAQDSVSMEFEIAKSFKNFREIPNYDLVILQKTMLSTGKVKKIAQLSKKFIYDADDRIWLRPLKKYGLLTQFRINHRLRTICKYAKQCMVPNDVIATDIREFGGKSIIIPMALDGKAWFPKVKENKKFVIGWTGAPGNLPFLEAILPSIKIAIKTNPNVKFVIHCGKNPYFQDIDYEYIRFEAGKEQEVVRSFDIGLLPLPQNDPFADGKSPIKGIQYIASGVVIVATKTISAVNLLGNQNDEFQFVKYAERIDDWAKILSQLIRNPNELTHFGKKGRDFFESNYESGKTYKLLRSVLQNCCKQ